MKRFMLCYQTLAIAGGLMLLSIREDLQAQPGPDHYSYVIIGAFKLKSNAEKFASVYSGEGLNTNVRKNLHNQLHYVYTFRSPEVEDARKTVYKIRSEYPVLQDTWLYNGDFNGPHIPSDRFTVLARADEEVEDKEDKLMTSNVEPGPTLGETAAAEPFKEEDEGVYTFYFNAIQATNAKEVVGDIKVYDAERNKLLKTFKSHEKVKLKRPDNRTHRVRLETDVFGYKGSEYTIDLDEMDQLDTRNFKREDGTTIVNFNMVRVLKGDIVTMWKVYFYIDAAIMKEESVYQLNQLLDMMKENPKIKIMIHGHTNGNASGEVMHLDTNDTDFFTLGGNHKKTTASAKKLSLYRAYTIQRWLMDQGIAENRMQIKGWGGKKMIYDKHDSQAHKNVRVEIEIIDK